MSPETPEEFTVYPYITHPEVAPILYAEFTDALGELVLDPEQHMRDSLVFHADRQPRDINERNRKKRQKKNSKRKSKNRSIHHR